MIHRGFTHVEIILRQVLETERFSVLSGYDSCNYSNYISYAGGGHA